MLLFPPWEPKLDVELEIVRLGEGYNAWNIVPDELGPNSVVCSFGVGEDVSFDLELMARFELTIHAFDPTPKSIAWVKQQAMPPHFIMHPYGIGASNGLIDFFPPENPEHVSHTILQRPTTETKAIQVPLKTLSTIVEELDISSIDILKMDIEGAEYAVIDNILGTSLRPQQWLIEFHHRFPEIGISKTKRALKMLRKAGYKLCSISETQEEYSFIYRP